uniref:Uncharacterized protein n=1 Tax=Anguilla anguilla TaxID=7936 RepID=A0A0E9WU66_ANGAN
MQWLKYSCHWRNYGDDFRSVAWPLLHSLLMNSFIEKSNVFFFFFLRKCYFGWVADWVAFPYVWGAD